MQPAQVPVRVVYSENHIRLTLSYRQDTCPQTGRFPQLRQYSAR